MELGSEKDFCGQIAIEYLKANIEKENKYYYSTALSILFQLNLIEALKYLTEFIDNDINPSINAGSFTNYIAIENYDILERLFENIYLKDSDKIGYSGLSSFLNTYVVNLSATKDGHQSVLSILNQIKSKLELQNSDNGKYQINQLIDASNNSHINSQSKALTFQMALSKIEEIL